jgi:hypothetical protein
MCHCVFELGPLGGLVSDALLLAAPKVQFQQREKRLKNCLCSCHEGTFRNIRTYVGIHLVFSIDYESSLIYFSLLLV